MTDAAQATDPRELRRQIMSATEPKSEREWWACREIERLCDALTQVFTGGNHLASVLVGRLGGDFADKYPPHLDHGSAMQRLDTENYELWCCWAAMMRARDLRDGSPT